MITRRNVCLALFSTVIALASLSSAVRADDKKVDATGTWKWEFKTQAGETRETTLKLKQDGDKLTGTVTGRDGKETEIKDGSIKGDAVSFKVTRKGQNDQEITISYTGTLAEDTIKGKTEMAGGNGQARSRDWEAKRAK